MAIELTRRGPRGRVGLDIDGAYLAAVETQEGRVTRAASTDLPAGVVVDGEVNDQAALSDALKAFFRRHSLPRRVHLGVANSQIAVRSMDLPPIEDEIQRAAAVRFQASEAIAMPLDEVVLDYQVVGDSTGPEGTPRTRIVVVAARQSMISSLLDAVRGAGLRPEGIDLSAFALVRSVADPTPSEQGARVYCHLAGVTNLAVTVGSTCLFTRTLASSRDESGAPVPMALAEDVRLSIDYYSAQPESPPVSEVVLSGPDAARDGLADELSGLVGMPVTGAEPLLNVESADMPVGEDLRRHSVAAGLALGAAA